MLLKKIRKTFSIYQIIIVSLLLLLVIISAVPSYLQGKWSWMKPPEITNLKQLRELQQTGLILPEWQTIQEGQITVGGHKWWVQIIRKEEEKPIFLLLLGQRNHTDQPEVEWMDIQGKERWKSDSYRQLKFNVDSASVVARFFRTYGTKQGFAAVVQWYATPNGGYTAPFQWFVADRLAQLHKSRVPWVAVSLKIPTQPGANIETVEELAKSLAKTVQKSLMEEIFSVSS